MFIRPRPQLLNFAFLPIQMHILHSLLVLGILHAATCTAGTPQRAVGPTGDAAMPALAQTDPRGGDVVLKEMGPIRDKVVADLFCGDGYYTWKLLSAGARVVAIDDDPDAIARMEAWKASQGISDDRLQVRLTMPGNPGLMPEEVDMALITREYSTLIDRQHWISDMLAGIKSPRLFFLVNYLPVPSEDGPPMSQRMDFELVSDELFNNGIGDIGVGYQQLPGRYILFGAQLPDSPEDGE